MSTFQGFNLTGIDPNQYPVFTDDNDMRHDLFYLTLEPIGADADYEKESKAVGLLLSRCGRRFG